MKQFNLAEYLVNPSRKVITRDGRKVTRFLCTDAKSTFPLVALIEVIPGSTIECLRTYTKDGSFFGDQISPNDLFFAPEKHEGWINVYKWGESYRYTEGVFSSKEKALKSVKSCDIVATIKIEWEE